MVEVAGTLRVDASLEVGTASESVTVTEVVRQLKTEGGEVSHNVSTDTLNNLPILTLVGAAAGIGSANSLGNIRNPLASVQLLPGARITTDTIMRINGMPSNSQSINIEGQDATNGFFKQQNQINQAGVEAIQEVAIQTSNFAAEYGQAGGGYFNYTMKSGTNQLHGSGFDYFVNEALNAGLPFTDRGTTNAAQAGQHIRNPLRQNDYGFTLGGPINIPKIYDGHDKSFFFFSFEQFRQSANITNTFGVVPSAAYRSGDFSAALTGVCNGPDTLQQQVCVNQIFDPTTNQVVNGSVVRSPFPGNKIPLTSMDPTAKIIQGMIPAANGIGLLNYNAPAYSNYRHTTIPSIKIDQNLSARMKLSGYYSANKTFSPQNNGFTNRTPPCSLRTPWRKPYGSTWIRRSLQLCCCISARVICTRPILRRPPRMTRSNCFPMAFPSPRATFSPIWRACSALSGAGGTAAPDSPEPIRVWRSLSRQ